RGPSALATVSRMQIVCDAMLARPARLRSEVVLPRPDGPRSTSISPLATSRLRSSTATTPSKRVELCSKVTGAEYPSPRAATLAVDQGSRLHGARDVTEESDHHPEHQRQLHEPMHQPETEMGVVELHPQNLPIVEGKEGDDGHDGREHAHRKHGEEKVIVEI